LSGDPGLCHNSTTMTRDRLSAIVFALWAATVAVAFFAHAGGHILGKMVEFGWL